MAPAFAERVRRLKRQALTVWFLARHPRLPWGMRWLALAVAAYAFSPIDLIPDFIPVLGWLDDLLLGLVLKLSPADVVDEARIVAQAASDKPVSQVVAMVIGAIWIALLLGFG